MMLDATAVRFVDEITVYFFTARDGETHVLAVDVLNPDGSDKDLTNATAEFRAIDAAGQVAISKSSVGGAGIGFVGNCVEVTIEGADWAPVVAGLALYESAALTYHLRLSDAAAQASDLQEGAIEVMTSIFTP